ncbi:hypothetical protein chiPu_0006222 [Chiloscyllium punctatum]|uniref:Uncharacterized protein n=1 Tax=Chiloscyllium punctatum TaxID=137246 RepID=A0A401SBL9_CHIPU|nr:hypothetical protein [Chiloscyllium punctatum]
MHSDDGLPSTWGNAIERGRGKGRRRESEKKMHQLEIIASDASDPLEDAACPPAFPTRAGVQLKCTLVSLGCSQWQEAAALGAVQGADGAKPALARLE